MRLSHAVVAITLGVAALTVRVSAQAPPFVPGEILVKFRAGPDTAGRADAHRAARGTPLVEVPRTRLQRVRVRAGDEEAAIARYRRHPAVLYAERNVVRRIPAPAAHDGGADAIPGDYYFDEQWGFHNTGQPFFCVPFLSSEFCILRGTTEADIDAPEAWAITRGTGDVTVAVIDSGVDYTHPDLAPNYAGGDDFVSSDGDPMDDHGHGTHVAGTIAAALENLTGTPAASEGVAGVAPNARILAYKVCRPDGTCDDFAIQQAIARAIADGAKVVNLSLGDPAYSQSLDDAVQDAWNAGLVIVAAAGNNGVTDPFYPAALNNVVSVAAFDHHHRRATFSNHGAWVDVSAPGSVIMSAERSSACAASPVPGRTGCYTWRSGTSMAAPHVSGAAALVWSRGDVTTNRQVVDILLASADGSGVAAERLDAWTAHGGLNVHDAVGYGLTNLPPRADAGADQRLTDADGDGGEPVSLDGSASADADGSIVSYTWREDGAFVAEGATPDVWLAVGSHVLTLEVIDDEGGRGTDRVTVTVDPANEVTVIASPSAASEAGPAGGGFAIGRTGSTTAPLTVYFVIGGTASAGTDYLSLPGAVTIGAGSAVATVAVTPIDDAVLEDDESVTLTLSANSAYRVGTPGEAAVTIASDDLPPDLIVASLAAPATGGAGGDLIVTDTTTNQGTGPSLPSRTAFYLSANTALDASDVLLGSRAVGALQPAASDASSTTLNVPASTGAGSYRILAKADPDGTVEEGVETNNVRASGVVRIGPDLVVSVLAAPAGATAGSTVDVSETTKNQGGGGAAGSATHFYLSANTTLDVSDVMLGTRAVPPLAPGASHAASTRLTLPGGTAAGAYYVIAQADAAGALIETVENNNNRTSGRVTVGADLVVTAIAAPSSAAPGATITVTDTTKNQGPAPAPASSTGFYLSGDTVADAGDLLLGSRAVGALAPGAAAAGSVALRIPADIGAGFYYVIARADWAAAVPETVETNNDRRTGSVSIGADLAVTAISAPATALPGGTITVSDTTRNQGAVPVPESATGFYLSANTMHDASDLFLGSRSVASLGPSEPSSASTLLVVPAGMAVGRYYVIGVADSSGVVAEGNEINNARSSSSVRIGPDLVVPVFAVPSSAVAGTSISASDTTRNDGGDTAAASITGYYLSANLSLDAGDVLLATREVPALAAGAGDAESVAFVIPPVTAPGTYFILAKADAWGVVGEALEDNNTRARTISIAAVP